MGLRFELVVHVVEDKAAVAVEGAAHPVVGARHRQRVRPLIHAVLGVVKVRL